MSPENVAETDTGIEKEVKFRVEDVGELRERVISLGGKVVQERRLEKDVYFLKPPSAGKELVRLRTRGDEVTLAFKGPVKVVEEVTERKEVEIDVGNGQFEEGLELLGLAGFKVTGKLEKWRESFELAVEGGRVVVRIDELPKIGAFVEIELKEGEREVIEEAIEKLGFDPGTRVVKIYQEIYTEKVGGSSDFIEFKKE